MNQSITDLIRGVPVVGPDDSLRRAASLLRATDGSSLIVISNAQIVGTVSEKAIAAAIAGAEAPETALDAAVSTAMDAEILYVQRDVSIRDAAAVFATHDVDVLPVIDTYGSYRGALHRGDLIGYATRSLKLPPVAGMATPLGVYLTTGTVSGGAGNLGLFLTGASLGLIILLSTAAGLAAMHFFSTLLRLPPQIYMVPHPVGAFGLRDIPYILSMLLSFASFALLMRFSPLSGYHAAEHMTVHAIESGEILTPETVARMPRVHPRCGTNILAGAGLFMLISSWFDGSTAVLVAMLIVVLGWRTVGSWLQRFITTSDPSPKQLANGVAAGQQLVERYHQQPNRVMTGFGRIWKMGLLQTASGMALVLGSVEILQQYIRIPLLGF